MPALDLKETYLHLADGGMATQEPLTPTFWQELMSGQRHYPGRLMGAMPVSGSMGHWEMHPNGDELLLLLSGALDVTLEAPDGTRSTTSLSAGQLCFVPKGTWHRFDATEPGELVFITAGEGTQTRPV